MEFNLWIGNKNYSSWSMRVWLVLKHFDIVFNEHLIQFDGLCDGKFKQTLSQITPAGKVPTLVWEGFPIWDSLAICEFLAEHFPNKKLWPDHFKDRARARSICAEMHSGFTTLRTLCPMNIDTDLTEIGLNLWHEHIDLRKDIQRVEQIWSERSGIDTFLFGDFSIADAFFAPVVMRVMSYGLPVSQASQSYIEKIIQVSAVSQWIVAAKEEKCFVESNEPYRINNP